jgi:hypothetical protein
MSTTRATARSTPAGDGATGAFTSLADTEEGPLPVPCYHHEIAVR